jgi:4a-hydroxytetrahydrobiopterin dehydratase
MGEKKLPAYAEADIPGRIMETGLDGWYLEDGWLRKKYNTDGWPTTPK